MKNDNKMTVKLNRECLVKHDGRVGIFFNNFLDVNFEISIFKLFSQFLVY